MVILSRKLLNLVPVLAMVALAACAGGSEPSPIVTSLLSKPAWGTLTATKDSELGTNQAVAPEDFVDASGRCGAIMAEAPASAAAGDPVTTPAVATDAPQPVLGGIALGMTECQVAQRAGTPAKADLTADESGERKVVLSYPSGNWPGIYTFVAGRLKEVQRVVEPPPPPKPVKKKKTAKPKTA